MLTLHLLRHAKTNQISPTGKDFDRELLPKGLKQCAEMKSFLLNESIPIDQVLCSKAKRTLQTHELCNLNTEITHFSKNLYLCSAMEMIQEITHFGKEKNILVVGHNDGISELASYLCDSYIHLQTCGFVSIHLTIDNWNLLSRGVGILKSQFRPEVN